MEQAYLTLADGRVFRGTRIGAPGGALGELVFTTGMVGCLETLTDPSFSGQIVMQTFPLIGNYGVIPEDFEGEPAVRGYVVRELCGAPSNFRSEGALNDWLCRRGIPGIAGVDTRELTQIIREQGVMNACIAPEPATDLDALRRYAVTGAVAAVSRPVPQTFPAEGTRRFRVVLLDYGVKANIIRSLCRRGCEVTAVPFDTTAEAVLAAAPDGVVTSNGPGDPAENTACIAELRKLVGRVPMMGVCLGHQLTALALGGRTEKLKFGHRGANQPARDLVTGRTYMTSQNHGYTVVSESLSDVGRLRWVNANDGSCEGVDYPGLRCFTVQFHPEACAGPRDTAFLFDRFVSMMEGREHA